ncbi:MAG: glycoside hydrolase family 97 catalytic domain-containing protein [Spirochaetales bacterium]|nr:glycoside hydrolase family 97 catalytic domain-containing protein [Spirochaetales bacterium]
MKSSVLFVLFLLFVSFGAFASVEEVVSPSGEHSISVAYGDCLKLSIKSGDQLVLDDSSISLVVDGVDALSGAEIVGVVDSSESNIVDVVVPNTFSQFKENYNQKKIIFSSGLSLVLRAYDDGVAYRWESNIQKDEIFITNEKIDLQFAYNFNSFFPRPNGVGFFSHHENLFRYQRISHVRSSAKGAVPYLVELGGGRYMLLSDVNVEHYPGLWLSGTRGLVNPIVSAIFPKYPASENLVGDRSLMVGKSEDYIAKISGKSTMPWRAFVLTDANGLLTSSMLYLLAEPSRIDDVSWIKPGLVSWDWWNDWNLTTVDFKPGINQQTYMHYIDFASEYGLPYIILDEGWSKRGPENLLSVIEEIDMPALSEYATSKNVGLILWMTSIALDMNYDAAFEQFKKWNVKGLKVDFLQRDDQKMMEFCYRVSATAAKYKMLVDIHGGPKPVGISRTYPNLLTIESVQGLEQNKWSSKNANPEMAVLLPFTRMVVGPMDYTPGAMQNRQRLKYRISYSSPKSLGTRAHQLAMYVVYISPLQMLADTPCNYRANPESLNFIKDVPVVWDETVALENRVGDYVAVARRSGDTWYIGAMTDWTARELTLSLGFLADGEWEMTLYADGEKANTDGTDLKVSSENVNNQSEVRVKMARGGGFAAVIKKK